MESSAIQKGFFQPIIFDQASIFVAAVEGRGAARVPQASFAQSNEPSPFSPLHLPDQLQHGSFSSSERIGRKDSIESSVRLSCR